MNGMHQEIRQCLLDLKTVGLLQTRARALKNGVASPVFVDFKQVISFPDLLKKISELMWKQARPLAFDYLCAAPHTAVPLATSCAIKYHIPLLSVSGGKVSGWVQPNRSVVVMEDFITTGANVLRTIAALDKAGLGVSHVIAFCDRQQGGKEKLAQKGITLHSVVSMPQLIQVL